MGGMLVLGGAVVAFVGLVLILIAAFRESILWGLACLFIHIVCWIFVFLHWEEAKSGFMHYLCGVIAMVAGRMMGAH